MKPRRRVRPAVDQHVQIAALLALGHRAVDFGGKNVKINGKTFVARHYREVVAMRRQYRAERAKRNARKPSKEKSP